jgi:hypothetical protein
MALRIICLSKYKESKVKKTIMHTLLCCIVNMGDAAKVLECAAKHNVRLSAISTGKGLLSSRLLGFLGLNEAKREIVTMVVEHDLASGAIKSISEDMEFEKPRHGIAFTLSVSQFIGSDNIASTNSQTSGRGKSMYQIIYVVVDKGNAEDVFDAASKAGARGGTIMNARSALGHADQSFFPWQSSPNKEIVFIISKT